MQGAARVLVGVMLAATVAAAAHGQDYPTRPIKMLVPAAPGGIGDILPRIFGQKLAESGSHTVVVENRTAGAGVVAAEASPRRRRTATRCWSATEACSRSGRSSPRCPTIP